jgi:hypothetical protein
MFPVRWSMSVAKECLAEKSTTPFGIFASLRTVENGFATGKKLMCVFFYASMGRPRAIRLRLASRPEGSELERSAARIAEAGLETSTLQKQLALQRMPSRSRLPNDSRQGCALAFNAVECFFDEIQSKTKIHCARHSVFRECGCCTYFIYT